MKRPSRLGGQGVAAAAVGEGHGNFGERPCGAADGDPAGAELEPPAPGRHRRLGCLHQSGEAVQIEVDEELVIGRRLVGHWLDF